jgi:hypothetical protein
MPRGFGCNRGNQSLNKLTAIFQAIIDSMTSRRLPPTGRPKAGLPQVQTKGQSLSGFFVRKNPP